MHCWLRPFNITCIGVVGGSGIEGGLDVCNTLSSSGLGGAAKRTNRGQILNLNSNFEEEVAVPRVNGCERSTDRGESLLDQDPLVGISFDGQGVLGLLKAL